MRGIISVKWDCRSSNGRMAHAFGGSAIDPFRPVSTLQISNIRKSPCRWLPMACMTQTLIFWRYLWSPGALVSGVVYLMDHYCPRVVRFWRVTWCIPLMTWNAGEQLYTALLYSIFAWMYKQTYWISDRTPTVTHFLHSQMTDELQLFAKGNHHFNVTQYGRYVFIIPSKYALTNSKSHSVSPHTLFIPTGLIIGHLRCACTTCLT